MDIVKDRLGDVDTTIQSNGSKSPRFESVFSTELVISNLLV